MQRKIRMQNSQRRLVEGYDIVPKDKGSPLCQLIQLSYKILGLPGNTGTHIGIGSESTNFPQDGSILAGGFDIEAETFCPLLSL